jgi:hypothetical protein
MAYDIYLLLEGSRYTKITGVTAESKEDVDNYDGSLYDLSVSAAFNGGTTKAIGSQASFIQNPGDGTYSLTNSSAAVDLGAPGANKVAPTAQPKKRTRYKWTTATGLFWAWADQVVAVSTTPFGLVGGAIPAAYT